jgi:hypothetical protein
MPTSNEEVCCSPPPVEANVADVIQTYKAEGEANRTAASKAEASNDDTFPTTRTVMVTT